MFHLEPFINIIHRHELCVLAINRQNFASFLKIVCISIISCKAGCPGLKSHLHCKTSETKSYQGRSETLVLSCKTLTTTGKPFASDFSFSPNEACSLGVRCALKNRDVRITIIHDETERLPDAQNSN